MKNILIFVMVLLLLIIIAACTPRNPSKENESTNEVVFVAENEDFRIKTYIDKQEFNENEEIKLYSTLEYIGSQSGISIWSGDPYFHYDIYDGETYFNQGFTRDVLMETVLKKGEIYRMPFSKSGGWSEDDPKADLWREYFSEKELKLPKGKYVFSAYTAFSLDREQEDRVKLRIEFDVIVK